MNNYSSQSVQEQFINKIKAVIPKNENLVQSIAEVLNLSIDSAYRRIRCEKLFSIDEVALLCSAFKVNFNQEVELYNNKAFFEFTLLKNKKENFTLWLTNILENLKLISANENNVIIYSADDVPIWHHFNDENLIRFKLFYWLKTILSDENFVGKNFEPSLIPIELVEKAKDISKYYNLTTSIEIWTEDTFNSTIKQVEYFWESGFFANKRQATEICEAIENEINILQKICSNSSKTSNERKNFTMYQSEVMVGNNSIIANIGPTKISYVSYNTFNMMTTTNPNFVTEAEDWLNNLIKKSILISGAGEKQRNQFFNKILQKVNTLKLRIDL